MHVQWPESFLDDVVENVEQLFCSHDLNVCAYTQTLPFTTKPTLRNIQWSKKWHQAPVSPKTLLYLYSLKKYTKKRIRDEMCCRLCPKPLYFLITVEQPRGPTHLIGQECWCVAGAQRRVCLLIGSCLATVCFMLSDITGYDWCS